MARHHGTVLVDANVIIEAHRTRTWSVLAGGYEIETVEAVVEETQTGFQLRNVEEQIDLNKLRVSLSAVHAPSDRDHIAFKTTYGDAHLDEGEESLWTHALERTDEWILCGPDKASLRLGCRLGFRVRLVSMERLLRDVGTRSMPTLRTHYTQSWHEQFLTTVVLQP